MSYLERLDEAQRLLFDEAAALDQRRWDDWLALYTEDCEFWVPAWKSEHAPTADPAGEVSLVYYDSRVGLQERVWRIQSAAAPAHRLLPRTCHAVHNVRLLDATDDRLVVHATWRVDSYKEKTATSLFGYYDYQLAGRPGAWRIARKKITLVSDCVPSYFDVYQV
ncbi:aromatic-ring-hydroxylating dioxygenase subunit beta [Immundisolibacter sp.]|uniref:aromatic-ring-hydroxylating dioxygenase subunit beta n=1 Tax=Immundisolibacter sp. TaxID=1934948 RepID=UPI0026035540|nr:aromatic-ring-hydroxylating dioxygenase subunit beta [Immundisolibacter sp.]MDD3651596.1 aromatic-ring-hydroxylating dioxygenase subunit beta [Immundisolibacter sp.]